ncbi:hypothetical protein [Bartonella apis]|uniref:hypothetical protein n=1 Tax=Bartonella apis TaxID=1686310 RepID=UPI00242A5A63|nr:hypothetical protein [Bartonella apis]MCT6823986.1 hypothetical protein [Bartonella apis]MCT6886814.1 hypothetical protein [Bartonella apis]
MTACARTVLKTPDNESCDMSDSLLLATFSSLEARLRKVSGDLEQTVPASAKKNVTDDRDEWVMVVNDKAHPQNPVASCHMTLTNVLGANQNLDGTSLGDSFEVEGDQTAPVILTIAPFECFDKSKAHRAQGLLWQAISHFCQLQNVDYVIGSLAFDSRYPAAHALELSYLYHFCRSQSGLHLRAAHGVTMDIMPEEAIKPDEAFSSLPPMLRYCLRVGAKVADNAVVDRASNETRVFLLFPAKKIVG